MGLLELGGASAAEKIGWLGLGGGFFVAFYKGVRWLSRLEQAAEIAKEERAEMLVEMRGLRSDINAILTRMANQRFYDGRTED
jgi:hypothetical protein